MKKTLNLTSEQIKELKELNNYPLDYCDIAETVDFSKARFRYCNSILKKEPIPINLDDDLIIAIKETDTR